MNATMIHKYIVDIKQFLDETYEATDHAEWRMILALLEDNLVLYKMCQDTVKEEGVFDHETKKKNPLLSTMKDLQATIMKQVQHLGLSPYANAKIKTQQPEDDEMDFIEALTSTKKPSTINYEYR